MLHWNVHFVLSRHLERIFENQHLIHHLLNSESKIFVSPHLRILCEFLLILIFSRESKVSQSHKSSSTILHIPMMEDMERRKYFFLKV